jgi:putative FmdB family regulatory protein
MPVYEFQCEQCGTRFEELLSRVTDEVSCPECGSRDARRILSAVSPPSRLHRGPRVRDSESRRREREAARGERLREARKRRGAGGKG